jgi:PsbP-like protein
MFGKFSILSGIVLGLLATLLIQFSFGLAQEDNNMTANQSGITQGFSTYNNPIYGISINYPSDWEVREEDANKLSFHKLEALASFFVFVNSAEPTDTIDKVAREDMASSMALFGENYHVENANKTKLGGNNGTEANQVISNYITTGGEKIKSLDIVAIKDGTLYRLTFTIPADAFNTYLPTVKKMIDSFRITGFT